MDDFSSNSAAAGGLQEGLAAAKAGDTARAKALFQKSVDQDPANEMAWICLSAMEPKLSLRVKYLRRALRVNPESPKALNMIKEARRQLAQALLERGGEDIEQGRRESAELMLLAAAELDPENTAAATRLLEFTAADGRPFNRLSPVAASPQENAANSSFAAMPQIDPVAPSLEPAAPPAAHHTSSALPAVDAQPVLEMEPESADKLPSRLEQDQIPVPIANSTKVVAASDSSPSAPACLFCNAELRESFDRCPLCGGIQVFFDPRLTDDARLSERTDHSQILGAVNRITLNLRTSPESSELHYALALAYLNLGRVSTAVESLRHSQKFGPRPALEQEIARLLAPPEGDVVPPPVASESGTVPEGAVPDASEDSGEHPSTGKVVLVAEESAVLRKLIAGALEKEGYTVVTVADGVEALERFNESTLDMVLLDAAMPQMDGYQVCRSIRTATKELPIVLLSARDGFFDKVRGRVAGCTAYVTKPFLREDLITTVRQHCPLNTPQETFQS